MRRARRRPVHYITFCFGDGAVVGSIPTRKPSQRRINVDGIRIDADYVLREYKYAPNGFEGGSDAARVRMADLLSNRLNMRRTVRELVLPELAKIGKTLQEVTERLDVIERSLSLARRVQDKAP